MVFRKSFQHFKGWNIGNGFNINKLKKPFGLHVLYKTIPTL